MTPVGRSTRNVSSTTPSSVTAWTRKVNELQADRRQPDGHAFAGRAEPFRQRPAVRLRDPELDRVSVFARGDKDVEKPFIEDRVERGKSRVAAACYHRDEFQRYLL